MGDWLGTGNVRPQDKDFLPFVEARAFAHALGLKNQVEWQAYSKSDLRPEHIPGDPWGVYRNDGWGDWLGTVSKWTPQAVLTFLRGLRDVLPYLTAPEVL